MAALDDLVDFVDLVVFVSRNRVVRLPTDEVVADSDA